MVRILSVLVLLCFFGSSKAFTIQNFVVTRSRLGDHVASCPSSLVDMATGRSISSQIIGHKNVRSVRLGVGRGSLFGVSSMGQGGGVGVMLTSMRKKVSRQGLVEAQAVSEIHGAEAALSILSTYLPHPVVRDVVCATVGSVGAVGWLGLWSYLSSTGALDSKVSRKLVHCGSGPLFLLTWPLFSQAYFTRAIAGAVPAINAVRLLRAGMSEGKQGQDSKLVGAISRSGDPKEVLKGPFIYTLVLAASTFGGWLTVPAISAVCQMAAGDGMADLVGRRWGTVKWPWSQSKSVVGSLAFFGAAFAATLAEIAWFHAFGAIDVTPQDAASRVAMISAACTVVELIPFYKWFGIFGDDNLSVPIVGAVLASMLF